MVVFGGLRGDFRARHPLAGPPLCVCAGGAPHSLWGNHHALPGAPFPSGALPPAPSSPPSCDAVGGPGPGEKAPRERADAPPVSASGCSRAACSPHLGGAGGVFIHGRPLVVCGGSAWVRGPVSWAHRRGVTGGGRQRLPPGWTVMGCMGRT